ncbi:MAG: hypothetical protein AAF196_17105 [Planctomycetota bacterium]
MNHSDFFFGAEAEPQEPNDSVGETVNDSVDASDSNRDGTEPSPDEAAAEPTNVGDIAGLPWDEAVGKLQAQFPGTSDGILFCVHKLLSDKEARLAEFRGEAEVRSIKLSGRSIHSAKVLLGYADPVKRRSKKAAVETTEATEPAAKPRARRATATKPRAATGSPSEALAVAVEQIQTAAREEAEGLKDAIRQAIAILQDAVED